ncbi:MAG: TetR/AcrR family transcriptional regulator [Paracoccaceae bacterium]|jgi:AcrR family transcriptional regulator|nr:TetR/AcrR family transcriptional regulator [Paracoccaceae bacterium]
MSSKGERTAKGLLEAARDLFVINGYAAVSMREIALKMGINAGAIYNHFPSKQEILFRLLQDHMLDLLEQWKILEAKHEHHSDQLILQTFVNFHIAFHVNKSKEVFISYMELRSLNSMNFLIISKLRDDYENGLRKILELGKKNKNLDFKDAEITTKAILGMLSSITHWYDIGGRLSTREIQKIYWELIYQSVQGDKKINV